MTGAIRVLLVEDSSEDAELLLRELRRGGYDPESRRVENEGELRAAVGAEDWDIAICDWSLPVFSAPNAIATLKDVAFQGPVIIVSGTMGEEHVVEAMRSGADDYVIKGDLRRLIPAIDRELREASIRAEGRRAEGRLMVSEARLRSLVEAIPATTYVARNVSDDGNIVLEYVSPQITAMSGYPPGEFVGNPSLWHDMIHPDDRDEALEKSRRHFSGGEPLRREFRVIARDGRTVWLRDEAASLSAEDGSARFSQGLLTDITGPKTTEAILRRQALIFETVHDAVVVVDLDGVIVDLNPGAEAMFGYTDAEIRGRTPDFLSVVDVTAAVLSTVERHGRWSGELPFVTKDGDIRTGELVAVPLNDEAGQSVGVVGVVRDVTERTRAEQELRRTLELLRTSDHERRLLLSRLVTAREEEAQRIAGELHDDPLQKLSAVALRLGVLRMGADEETQTRTVAQIQQGLDDTMSRLRHMLFELSPRSLETGGLAKALAEYVQHANQEEDLRYRLEDRLEVDVSMEMRTIAYRVILEALSNVRKHAQATTVTVLLAERDDGVLCRVTDDGVGITSERLGAALPGHMGTASMRQRVALASGWIEFDSELGQGTKVEFWLPGATHPR